VRVTQHRALNRLRAALGPGAADLVVPAPRSPLDAL
jgi:hypothetical protein